MDSGTALREFLEYVIGQLVEHPEDVAIAYELAGKRHVFNVRLHPEDMGRVIGKNGYTISSIRSLLDAAAAKTRCKAVLKIDED